MGSSLHFHGQLEHLPAESGETAGSRQAIYKPNVKRGLERGKPPADRRVVHFQISSSAGKCADLRHGQEMADVFPIDHLCGISRIARMYTEFPHGTLDPIFEAGRGEGEQSAMPGQRFGVGIVGVEPGRSWAARGHIPALRALSETFEIIGVANTSKASAEAAAAATGLPRAFAGVAELVAAPEVDIVTVAVKVPPHLEIVKAAIGAGKHVYCEWPLGNGLAEAKEMAALAQAKGVLGVVGTQARVAPEIEYLRHLIADGFVGEVLSTTLVARGGALQGGGSIPDKKTWAYLLDRSNGATLLTIPLGHTLAALTDVFGDVAEVSSLLAVRRSTALAVDTGETLSVTAPDQVLVSGVFASGVPISIHYRGGAARDGNGLFWEIHGTSGDIRVSGPSGHTQMVQLSLKGACGEEKTFRPLEVPASYRAGWPEHVEPGNVARLYARMAQDLRDGTRTAPSFDDAVAVHRIIAAIEKAAESGSRTALRSIT
jgi:predicted dehydrogenase